MTYLELVVWLKRAAGSRLELFFRLGFMCFRLEFMCVG